MKKRKKVAFWTGTCILFVLAILIGPFDKFTSGYFCDGTDIGEIYPEDLQTKIDLGKMDFEQEISPERNHFLGFEICFANEPEGSVGALHITILNEKGENWDEILVDLLELSGDVVWHKIQVNKKLNCKENYTLRFWAEECQTPPQLWVVDADYLSKENQMEEGVLLHYSYTGSAFSSQEKILILMFLLSVWLFLVSWSLEESRRKNLSRRASVFIFLTAVLAWNYMFNSMDSQNTDFDKFQQDSETLAAEVVYADRDKVPLSAYGLGWYKNVMNEYYQERLLTDGVGDRGYSQNGPDIYLENNVYVRRAAAVGNWIQFANGERFRITDVGDTASYLWLSIHLDADKELRPGKYGDLSEVLFFNSDGEQYAKGEIEEYRSQFGLQGKVFRHIARRIGYTDIISNLHLICVFSMAIVAVWIVLMLYKKYDTCLASCFYITFWLSPWVVNFARNLYWVEFTWFLPMAAGLFCSLKIENKVCRLVSYVVAFLTILIKCLCGYEYISVIMMGMIAFLVTDFLTAWNQKDKKRQKKLFMAILIMGFAALVGFMTALCCHAFLRGEGNLWQGIHDILEQDALRRINGALWNEKLLGREKYKLLSIWEVCCQYFHFPTQIIVGVDGNLFPLLCILPLVIFLYDYRRGKGKMEWMILYVVFFLTSISWYILAKAHSEIHTHMNYVLWYFGYVQVCFYVIGEKIRSLFRRVE